VLLDGEDRLLGVWSLEIAGDHIPSVRSIVNPEKLAHLGAVADLRKVLSAG
jgi:RNA polymerase sigma-70 factor (ECF subfamily)